MNRVRGFVVLILGVLAVALAVLWMRSESEPVAESGERPAYVLPVELVEVRRGRVRPSLKLTGSVRAARWARLAFERAGTLRELGADEAQVVAAGELLARLDDRDPQLSLTRAQADLSVARRRVELLEAGARPELVKRLAAELEAARAGEDLAELEVSRRTTLAEELDVSQAEMDRVRAILREARARSVAAAELLAEARAGTRAEDLAVAAAQFEVAQAELARARHELEKTRLVAPWAGTVIRRLGSEGDYLQPGEELLELADLEHLEIHVEVPAAVALDVVEGASIIVRSDAAPGFELHTEVDAAVPTADQSSRNFRAVARVLRSEQPDDVLRPGMFVRVELQLTPREDTLIVPADAVRLTEQGFLVARAERTEGGGLTARWVFVETLGQDANGTAVRALEGGLSAGDQVVLTGVDLSYDGVALMPRDAEGAGETSGPGDEP